MGDAAFRDKIKTIAFDRRSARPKDDIPTIKPHQVRPVQQPSWENGVVGEVRADGSFMPQLNERFEPMGVHEASGRRSEIEESRRRRHNAPASQ